ncbi:MAG: hypothetical protein OXI69_13790 [Acidobacteriota bacterium]|nr:hypothetical protein [Acidobacteriota bacterium]
MDSGSVLFEPASLVQLIDPAPRGKAIMKTMVLKPRMIGLSLGFGWTRLPLSVHSNQSILPAPEAQGTIGTSVRTGEDKNIEGGESRL